MLPEGNVVLTAADLQAWAEEFWSMFKERDPREEAVTRKIKERIPHGRQG